MLLFESLCYIYMIHLFFLLQLYDTLKHCKNEEWVARRKRAVTTSEVFDRVDDIFAAGTEIAAVEGKCFSFFFIDLPCPFPNVLQSSLSSHNSL